jgi:BirA family biotin operon repressor/biotin-[acetyl-CoA-carboxylase] ligase
MHAPSPTLASECGLVRLEHRLRVGSTMDEAHRLAQAGAEAGTLVLADAQDGGRGRGGRTWASEPEAGIWMTLIERPSDQRALDVLALRTGLALAESLQPFCDGRITLKWPNDLYIGAGKLAGILIEARWRESLPEWVAIGVGVNRRVPDAFPGAASVRADEPRDDYLMVLTPRALGMHPLPETEYHSSDTSEMVLNLDYAIRENVGDEDMPFAVEWKLGGEQGTDYEDETVEISEKLVKIARGLVVAQNQEARAEGGKLLPTPEKWLPDLIRNFQSAPNPRRTSIKLLPSPVSGSWFEMKSY